MSDKKTCNKCHAEKDKKWFYKLTDTRLRPECKTCTSKEARKRYIKRVQYGLPSSIIK